MTFEWQVVRGAEHYTLASGEYRIVSRALRWLLYCGDRFVAGYGSMGGAKRAAIRDHKERVWRERIRAKHGS